MQVKCYISLWKTTTKPLYSNGVVNGKGSFELALSCQNYYSPSLVSHQFDKSCLPFDHSRAVTQRDAVFEQPIFLRIYDQS